MTPNNWFDMTGTRATDVETVAEITAAYRTGAATPADIVARSYARMRALNDPAVFISILDEGEALKEAQALVKGK